MNVNRGKMTAAAVLAVTLLVVGGVTGYGLHRAGTVGQPFVEDGRLKVMASFYPMYDFARKVGKKDMMMFHVNKERTPVCTTNTCEGSSLFISVVEHPLGYSLSLL